MATESKTKASPNGAKTAKTTAKGSNQALTVAETVVDLPVGVVLGATDRITDLVEPFTDRSGADKQLKAYRTQLRRTLKRTERRGSTARRKATTNLKRNRDEVEQRVRKAIEAQTSRAQDLVDQVGERLPTLR
jgi:Holliday junction resolvasome RuvABC ATP-dependent DNA helicase subunit